MIVGVDRARRQCRSQLCALVPCFYSNLK
jgi:hypothetical protein